MAFRLPFDRDLDDSLRQIAREELTEAVRLLRDDYSDDPVTAVHEARKNLKKTRALLRLARPGLEKETYRRENAAIRDAARLISGARDADVMLQTVDVLAKREDSRVSPDAFAGLRGRLNQPSDAAALPAGESANGQSPTPASDGGAPAAVIDALTAVIGRIDGWPLDCEWTTIGRGISRAYKRGRDAFVEADIDPTTDNLHDWRKRVKDLWYHHRLLTDAWPDVLGVIAEEAHRLSELLGDDHDLGVLAERVAGADDAAILELIGEARAEHLRDARRLGRRIYAETGAAFTTRVQAYLRCAEAEAARDASA
ncbi:MAG TPA: CHAD domain-containing protein [Solirubrobacteraceae bacterium]|jgi:CHAD domain-containing protein|nr:CHAD domain-containing protein [Solirubrobacteraceae bacterium]